MNIPEQVTIINEDETITIIATMTPASEPPDERTEPGLQLIEEDEP